MTSILSISTVHSRRAAAWLAIAVAPLASAGTARACEMRPDLHIEVTSKFDTVPVGNDYTLADIAALAHQRHRDSSSALLGFYASEFGYTIDLVREGDQTCPRLIAVSVTLRLQHRLIEIGQEAATNSCIYPAALRHYRRLAEADELTVEHYTAGVAVMLEQASSTLKQTYAARAEDLDASLRDQIRGVVDQAIAPLHDARQNAQQAVNNSGELAQLAHACSI